MAVVLVFFGGFFISVFLRLYSIQKKNVYWNVLTVAYGILVVILHGITHEKPIDWPTALLFAGFLLIMGWAIVKFELDRRP